MLSPVYWWQSLRNRKAEYQEKLTRLKKITKYHELEYLRQLYKDLTIIARDLGLAGTLIGVSEREIHRTAKIAAARICYEDSRLLNYPVIINTEVLRKQIQDTVKEFGLKEDDFLMVPEYRKAIVIDTLDKELIKLDSKREK